MMNVQKNNNVDKQELLESLQLFDYFCIDKNVSLTTEKRRGIMQSSVYHSVNLHWKDSVFKFQNKHDEDINMYLSADIEEIEFDDGVLKIHIENCPEVVTIRCCKKH
jgi:hypothetical protein